MPGEQPATGRSSPLILAFLNQKGGVGKTTTTVNLGAAIALAGRRVCLVDLDPQAHLTLHLGVDPQQITTTVYDLLIDPQARAEDAVVNARPNLDAILAETDLAAAETELGTTDGRQQLLARKLAPIAHRYDLILIDCPPSLGLLTINALAFADEVVVPMQAHFLALQGVGKLLETVALVSQSLNPHLRVAGIVLCMHEGQTTLAREVVDDLDGFFEQSRDVNVPWRDCRVFQPPVRRNIKLAEAPSFGKTIFDYAPWCPGAIDYRRLAEQLIARADAMRSPEPEPVQREATHDGPQPERSPNASIEPKEPPIPEIVTREEHRDPAVEVTTQRSGDDELTHGPREHV